MRRQVVGLEDPAFAGMSSVMAPEDVAAEVERMREERSAKYVSTGRVKKATQDEDMAMDDDAWSVVNFFFVIFLILCVVAAYWLFTSFQMWGEQGTDQIGIADVCGTNAQYYKKLLFPDSECVEFD